MKHYPESRSQTEPSSPSWTNRRESGPENINCKVCRDLSKQREKYSKDPADTGCVCVPGLDIPYSPHVQHTKESNRNSMLLQSKTIHDERNDHGSCINRLTVSVPIWPSRAIHRLQPQTLLQQCEHQARCTARELITWCGFWYAVIAVGTK
jgi:hypothetical protein